MTVFLKILKELPVYELFCFENILVFIFHGGFLANNSIYTKATSSVSFRIRFSVCMCHISYSLIPFEGFLQGLKFDLMLFCLRYFFPFIIPIINENSSKLLL